MTLKHLCILTAVATFTLTLANSRPTLAVGPNLMGNSSFEGTGYFSAPTSTFSIVNGPSNAHTGSYAMRAVLSNSWKTCNYSNLPVWANTSYKSSIWVKGSGKVIFNALGSDWKAVLGSSTISATPKWTKWSFTFNSGSFTKVEINLYDGAGGGGTAYLDDISTGVSSGSEISFNPANPKASGFKYLVFDDEFNSESTIDTKSTGDNGYSWYTKQFFNMPSTTPSSYAISGGHLSINDCPNPWGDTLHTAMPADNAHGWKGTAFSGAVAFYAESRIACAHLTSIGMKAWPAFWMADMKTNSSVHGDMPGNPGYGEQIENDIMEYNPAWWDNGKNYGSTMHDWLSGPNFPNQYNLANANSTVSVPVGTDFTQYHTYGMLYVPATASNGWNGYRQAYFDGIPEGAVCWIGNQNYKAGVYPETEASLGSYEFSLGDKDCWDIILGSSQGGTTTMCVDYVRVYAVSPAAKVTID